MLFKSPVTLCRVKAGDVSFQIPDVAVQYFVLRLITEWDQSVKGGSVTERGGGVSEEKCKQTIAENTYSFGDISIFVSSYLNLEGCTSTALPEGLMPLSK